MMLASYLRRVLGGNMSELGLLPAAEEYALMQHKRGSWHPAVRVHMLY